MARLSRFRVSCLVLILVFGLAAWLARDLPRRIVEAALAEQLAARVRLDRLEIEDREHFRLRGLRVERLRDYPFVEYLEISEVRIESNWRDVLDNRFESLSLHGVEARLAPAPRVEPPDRPLPVIGVLILEPATIRVAVGEGTGDLRLVLEAKVASVGSAARGEVRASSPELELAPLFRLADPEAPPPLEGRLANVDAVLHLKPAEPELVIDLSLASLRAGDGFVEIEEPRMRAVVQEESIRLELNAARADLSDVDTPLDEPRIEATITPLDDGETLRFELEPELAWLDDATLEADWDVAGKRLRRLTGTLRGLDSAMLLPSSGINVTADADFRSVGDRLHYSVDLVPRRFEMAADRYLAARAGSTIHVEGDLPFDRLRVFRLPIWSGAIEGRVHLPSGEGRWGQLRLPAALYPVTASFEGRLEETADAHFFRGAFFRGASHLGGGGGGARPLTVGGAIALGGGDNDLSWNWEGGRIEHLVGLLRQVGLPTPPVTATGLAKASGTLAGPWATPRLAGRLRLDDVEAAKASETNPAWRLAQTGATASWNWRSGGPIRLRSLEAGGQLELPPLAPMDLTLTADGESTADLARGEVRDAALESRDLGRARISGGWHPGPQGTTEASGVLKLQDLGLSHWQKALEPLLGNTLPADLAFGGSTGGTLEASVDGEGAWHLSGPVSLNAGGFSSDDGSRVMEGLTGRWQVRAHGAPGAAVEAEAEGTAGGFLLLWSTFFGDFSDVEATLSASGSLGPAKPDDEPPWRITARGSVPMGPVIAASLESSPRSAAWRYDLAVEDGDLAATHDRYLSSLLEERLGRLDLGGALAATARGSYRPGAGENPATWSLTGRVKLDGVELASGGGQAAVAGLELDLPLELRRRPTAELAFTGPSLAGRLAFDRLAVRGLELPATDTDLLIEADAVGLEKPIALEILGGSLTFERLTLRDLLRPERHLETGIRLTDLQLEEIARAMELFPLEGALSGYLPRAALSPDRLLIEGGGEIGVFGGIVSLRDISGEDVLTRFPKITLSADFENIDLGRLTRRIDFGEMTGVLRGSLESCELFRGVPVRFSAHLETVATKGVPRTVDVKAINNITILGTGQGTNVFDRGLQRFFQKYTYSALGVDMRLDDDVLLLRGLEERAGKELFLRGRLPFRIDVVNAQPGKTVSFQAMVRRLKSLDFGTATSEPPVLD